MVPVLVQLKTMEVQEDPDKLSQHLHQFYIEPNFVPEGIEDADLLGKGTSTALIWKEGKMLVFCVLGKVFQADVGQPRSGLLVSVNTKDKSIFYDKKLITAGKELEDISTNEV